MDTFLTFLKSYAYDPKSEKPMRSTLGMTCICTLVTIFFMEYHGITTMHELGILREWMLSRIERDNLRILLISYGLIFVTLRLMLFVLQFAPEQYRKFIAEQEQNRKDDEYW